MACGSPNSISDACCGVIAPRSASTRAAATRLSGDGGSCTRKAAGAPSSAKRSATHSLASNMASSMSEVASVRVRFTSSTG